MGKIAKFPVWCVQQDCGQGGPAPAPCHPCRGTSGTPCLLQPCPRSQLPGLLQRQTLGEREFFTGLSLSGPPWAIPRSSALLSSPSPLLQEPFTSHRYSTTANTMGCALGEQCHSFCKTALLGEKGSGKCLPQPSCGA